MAMASNAERLCRVLRTILFMITMFASLLVASSPVLVSIGDITVCLAVGAVLVKRVAMVEYQFGSSLMDVPLLSVIRCIVLICVYWCCDVPGLCEGLYVGAAMVCCLASVVFLTIKACVFTPVTEIYGEGLQLGAPEKLHVNESWAMPVVFVCSLVFALGHVVVAHRTSCKARRKLLFYRVDPESVLAFNYFSSYKVPRSPTPSYGKYSKSDNERKRAIVRDQKDLPISFLADIDSLFLVCQGLTIHYKLSLFESPHRSLASSPFHGSSPNGSPRSISSTKLKFERPLIIPPKIPHHLDRSFSDNFNTSLCAPLLEEVGTPPTYLSDEISVLCLDDGSSDACSHNSLGFGAEDIGKVAVVLIHGFGGGVFSWRHVMSTMARQIGCPVVAFDRPGWGLTSRPRRKDWEDKHLPNPYNLESQVDLLISFCLELGFSSVILVGHDDGGLLALKVAEKVRTSANCHVDIKGVVLLSTSLSREVVPAFARILLHTSLGKKHMVRPLLRAEITQVINRHAWFDATRLTTEILALYKAPLYVEGWDEALHEIGRLSFATVLSPQNAAALLNSVEDLPILVVTGAEDALVPFKSAQAMASKLVNSRLVAISGCGHLPHEECPKALLAALTPFITRLLSTQDTLQNQ